MNKNLTRRDFLSSSAAAAATLGPLAASGSTRRRFAANDRVSCAVIGVRGMGHTHVKMLCGEPGAEVAAICDVDREMAERAAQTVLESSGKKPALYSDFRKLLEDPAIDAVTIASPNHWHTPMAILAMQAGKDVYLEKMGSHVFQEGKLLIEAARRYQKVVQHGTQMRSSEVTARAREVLDSGIIGEIKMAKAWNLQKRQPVLPVPDEPVPEGVDYDLWLGPAPRRPFNRNRFHYTWQFFRVYGNGDLGGDGIHDLDMARFGLNPKTHPVQITSHGSNIFPPGDREFPDNMTISYVFDDGRVMLYEDRLWTPYGSYGFDSGNAFYGTEGFMIFSRRGYFQVYLGEKGEQGPGMKGTRGHPQHMLNFLECVRSRKQSVAPPEEAHKSLALVHLGEIAYRTQSILEFDPKTERFTNHSEANQLLSKEYRAPWDPQAMLASG